MLGHPTPRTLSKSGQPEVSELAALAAFYSEGLEPGFQ